jgi:bifunctional enzyme CysN/CysC
MEAQKGATVWITGLVGAGKTTLARLVATELAARTRHRALILDGDDLRGGLSSDLGFSDADRSEQARRAAHVAALAGQSGLVAIVALVSPFARDRELARSIHDDCGLPFLVVWVDTPLAVCEQRGRHELYSLARAGKLVGLSGVDAVYEPPAQPDLIVAGDGESPRAASVRVTGLIEETLSDQPLAIR